MTQRSQGRRRGRVFSLRLTPSQEDRLAQAQLEQGGPRGKGAWLVWAALERRRGITLAPRLGSTPTSPDPSEGGEELFFNSSAPQTGHPMTLSAPKESVDFGEGAPPGTVLPARARARVVPAPAERVVLDLCAGSGAWSEPYVRAGYDVRRVSLPEQDVRTYEPPERVWGVLAAPPCDQFSLARNGSSTPRDLAAGLAIVAACLRIVAMCRPVWWALENPVGLLGETLGRPQYTFQPHEHGDAWTKRTAIWGSFNEPAPGPYVEPQQGGGHPCAKTGRTCSHAACRAITPPGFAQAFFEANG